MSGRRPAIPLLLAAALLLPAAAQAQQDRALPPGALKILQRLAIQHNGREKPFDSFAREVLEQVTGSPHVGRAHPAETVLNLLAAPDAWQDAPLVYVPFLPLREALGMDRKASHVSYNELVATRKLMRMLPVIVAKQQRDEKLSMLENETMDAFQRFVALSNLFEQKLSLVPPPPDSAERTWRSVLEPQGYPSDQQHAIRGAWTALVTAVRAGTAPQLEGAVADLRRVLQAAHPSAYPPAWRLGLEVFYNEAKPFRLARLLYALAACLLLVSLATHVPWARSAGFGGLIAGYLLHGSGIIMRVVLGGRPPVSNFFETILWLPFVAVTIALVFERVYRVRFFGLAASLLAAIALLIAEHVPLDTSITPVVAVLHSNLWLTIHVLTIVASYGALTLATAMAHVYGTLYLARRGVHPALAALDLYLYRALQVGVVLLAAGVMLGAVWANASWGRYWGWDPKETWALITLLWFLAILHGRFAGWLRGVGVALSTIGGFFLLLMTYYGVSFYLVGLHSYAGGHAKPLPLLLVAYLAAEVLYLALVGSVALTRRPAA